jgi:hypothetical protein
MSTAIITTVVADEAVAVTKKRMPAWAMYVDAKRQTRDNIVNFTTAERITVSNWVAWADNAYIRSRVFVNYRKTVVVIKVESPTVSDRVSTAVAKFDEFCESHGIVKHHSKDGHYLYHISPELLTTATYGA